MAGVFEIPTVWVLAPPMAAGLERVAAPRAPERPPNAVVHSRVCVWLT
jgi:hypothetical protein